MPVQYHFPLYGLRFLALFEPGATALAQGLRGNSVLEQLNLTGNFIGNAGVASLAGSLVGPSRGFLVTLWLSRWDIKSPGLSLWVGFRRFYRIDMLLPRRNTHTEMDNCAQLGTNRAVCSLPV